MTTIEKKKLQEAISLVLEGEFFSEWEFHDMGYEFSECNSCGWNSRKERRLGHHKNCELRAALDLIDNFLDE